MKSQIPGEEVLQDKLTPKFIVGCKRLLLHDKYYPAMALSHVKLHTEKIVKVENSKIVTTAATSPEIEVSVCVKFMNRIYVGIRINLILLKIQVLILATGFRFSDYFDPLKIIGQDSVDVVQKWKNDRPESYLSIQSHDTPNHFILFGPNTVILILSYKVDWFCIVIVNILNQGLGHNSVLFMIECQSLLIMQILEEMMKRGSKSVQPKKAVELEYMTALYDKLKNTVWTKGNCGAWYADARGNITALWPWNCTTYWRRTRTLNPNEFEF